MKRGGKETSVDARREPVLTWKEAEQKVADALLYAMNSAGVSEAASTRDRIQGVAILLVSNWRLRGYLERPDFNPVGVVAATKQLNQLIKLSAKLRRHIENLGSNVVAAIEHRRPAINAPWDAWVDEWERNSRAAICSRYDPTVSRPTSSTTVPTEPLVVKQLEIDKLENEAAALRFRSAMPQVSFIGRHLEKLEQVARESIGNVSKGREANQKNKIPLWFGAKIAQHYEVLTGAPGGMTKPFVGLLEQVFAILGVDARAEHVARTLNRENPKRCASLRDRPRNSVRTRNR